MDLKSLISNIQTERLKDSDAALKNIASSEKYLQQAYEGRYLFELIQNVRDANKVINEIGSIYIELNENTLTVSNTGAPFNEKGVNSISTIGDSPKDSQDYIGFKGIGFKSVCEICDTPIVLTEWGSILFDKEKTKTLLNGRGFRNRDIPLFFFPHYISEKLSTEDIKNGIVTRIILPLKSKINIDSIKMSFEEIGVHQLLLLGCLNKIMFFQNGKESVFEINEDIVSGKVTIKKNLDEFKFKHFKPTTKIQIPKSIIELLEDKEREIYEKEPFVDISLVFDIDEKGKLSKNEKSKLYLFYPTEITSGFNFIIHSYFIVNPERKSLRNSPLNTFILECIADYLSQEWLTTIKKQHKNNFLDVLTFDRNEEAPLLNILYERLIRNLLDQKIIYDKITRRFYKTDEIILADGFDKGLFPDNQLNNKRLVYIENEKTRDWLIAEFKIEYLTFDSIAINIENECRRQKDKGNFQYFENLYKYLVEHDDLNLRGKKVLLTNKMRLLSNEDDVFYGFKEKIEFPSSIQLKIHFINSKIKIADHRLGIGQTGFLEYKTELLVKRLLKLYNEKTVSPVDILTSLLKINIPDRLYTEIKQKILLPVKAKVKWLNPFNNPIYIINDELINLYPLDKFIDYEVFTNLGIENSLLEEKLIQLGAWNIPAIHYSDKKITLRKPDNRYLYLNSITGYSTQYYQINGDWLLDIPIIPNQWFSDTIINNWTKYLTIIEDENNPSIKYNSQTSYQYPLHRDQWKNVSSILKYLKEEKWLVLNENKEPKAIVEIVGIDPIEILQPQSFLFKKYLPTLPIQYSYNIDFITLIGIKHLDSKEISIFREILTGIKNLYLHKTDIDKEFISFYNKILSKLFDLFNYPQFNKNEILTLKQINFLGLNEFENKLEWKSSDQIYYIEDKPSYDILPLAIKKIIQPHFTNRDKNKFGQIGKRIGLDFKKVINQEISNLNILEESNFREWFPSLAESLALVEVLLETNLDDILNEIKETKTILCSTFNIELYKDSEFITTLNEVLYKIQTKDSYTIFVKDHINIKKNIFYANVLNDLLIEILGRDLSRIRLSLIDFIEQQDKILYLEKYEVPNERIDEIKAKLGGFTLSKRQFFWLSILSLKSINNSSEYFKDGEIDLKSISIQLNVSYEDLKNYNRLINFELINTISNIDSLNSLFQILNISNEEFNLKSEIKIDFRQFYINQLEGIKQKFKLNFSNKLYEYLSKLDISEQSKFQDTIDLYSEEPIVTFNKYVLKLDIENIFITSINKKYLFLNISQSHISKLTKNNYLKLFKENELKFKNSIADKPNYEKVLDDFFSINTNRSLLYFNNNFQELIMKFDVFYDNYNLQNIESQQTTIDLSQYYNQTDLKIIKEKTNSLGQLTSSPGQDSFSKGKRVDGGKQNPKNNLIGIVAEKAVYDILLNKYNSTEWISKNAAKAGINPEGSDTNGCDITYVDESNTIKFIEVKGKIDDQNHFYISYPEYCKALEKKENYHIIIVKNALDNEKREIIDIGNIFLLDENSDLFNNSKFSANFNILEIKYI